MLRHKIIGLIILAASALVFGIEILLAQISMYVDQLTGEYYNNLLQYIPSIVYVLLLISVSIGIFLCFYKEKIYVEKSENKELNG